MTDFYKGLTSGYNLGLNLGGQLRKRRMEDELAQLNNANVVEGVGLKITSPDGQSSVAVIDPNSGSNLNSIRQQYEQAGYKVEQLSTPQFAVRFGNTDLGIYSTSSTAEDAARKYNYGLDLRRANIYEKYGESELARNIRRDVEDRQRAERQLAMQERHYGLLDKKAQMEIERAEQQQQQEKAFANAVKELASVANGSIPRSAAIFEAINKHNLSPEYGVKLFSHFGNITKADIDLTQARIADAFRKHPTIDGIAAIYNSEFSDGYNMAVKRDKDGKVTLTQIDTVTGKPVTSRAFNNDDEAYAYIYTLATNPATVLALTHDLNKWKLEEQKAKADIELAKARTAGEWANIGLIKARTAGERASTAFANARIDKLPPAVKETISVLKQKLNILNDAYTNEFDAKTRAGISQEMANTERQIFELLRQYGGGLSQNKSSIPDNNTLLEMYNQASPEQKARFRKLYPNISFESNSLLTK